jgi:uncharacterized protein YvpB
MMRRILNILLFAIWFIFISTSFGETHLTSAKVLNNLKILSSEKEEETYTVNFPLVFFEDDPLAGVMKYCHTNSVSIPDNDKWGILDKITITDRGYIADMDVRLDIDHTWVGDLDIALTHKGTGISIDLLDRPGYSSGNPYGCRQDNIRAILDDEVIWGIENVCSSYPAAISHNKYIPAAIAGTYLPMQPLGTFDAIPVAGEWILSIVDVSSGDTGKLNQWCMVTKITPEPVPPPEPPGPISPPVEAHIYGVTGARQTYPLDCESRSAVDWARHFNYHISESSFFFGLPKSSHPDKGFVGSISNPYGENQYWGQLPSNPYGVHAEPIAKRLQEFGLPAVAHRPLRWPALKSEIAAGRPVIVWILGSGAYGSYDYVVNGIPEYYQTDTDDLTVVARFEHTVVVTEYTPNTVSYLNGSSIQTTSLKEFLESWSALGNMAVTYGP